MHSFAKGVSTAGAIISAFTFILAHVNWPRMDTPV